MRMFNRLTIKHPRFYFVEIKYNHILKVCDTLMALVIHAPFAPQSILSFPLTWYQEINSLGLVSHFFVSNRELNSMIGL